MTLRGAVEIGRLLWHVARGYRLRPWRSPYLRWRIETYAGQAAESVGPGAFWRFLWRERRGLAGYLCWSGALRAGEGLPPRRRRSPAAR